MSSFNLNPEYNASKPGFYTTLNTYLFDDSKRNRGKKKIVNYISIFLIIIFLAIILIYGKKL